MGNIFRKSEEDETMSHLPRPLFTSYNNLGRIWWKRAMTEQIDKAKHFEFTLASYNVLADKLMKDNPHLYIKGKQKDPGIFDWNYRKTNLLKEIKHANADILCLQEVQEEHYYDWFNPKLEECGYSGTFKKRSGDKPDGCATFFKQNKFSLESAHLIDYYKPNVALMDRNNVAILVFLSVRNKRVKKKSTLCVGNTHLLFNKRRGDIKLTQLAHLLAEVNYFSNQNKYDPKRLSTIICGDFNSVPFSPLYDFVVTGDLVFEGLGRQVISGQDPIARNPQNLGKTLFDSDTGLSHDCKWTRLSRLSSISDSKKYFSSDANSPNQKNIENTKIKLNEESEWIENSKSNSNSNSPHKLANSLDSSDIENLSLYSAEKPGHLVHNYSFSSCYTHKNVDGTKEVTTCHDRGADNVDYIFYTDDGARGQGYDQLSLRAVLGLLNENDLNNLNKLPNRHFSSDHMLLQASFALQQK